MRGAVGAAAVPFAVHPKLVELPAAMESFQEKADMR